MKLYNLGLSNFAGKCRVAIYEKGLDVELADAPGGPGSDAYKEINPTGKIPALETDHGQVILESEVINEYLEDKFQRPRCCQVTLKEGRPCGRLLVFMTCTLIRPCGRCFRSCSVRI